MAKFDDFINKNQEIGSEGSIEKFKQAKAQQEEESCDPQAFLAKIPTPKLEVKIGSLTLNNPITAAAGCFGYGVEYKEIQKLSELGAIFSNGTTLHPCDGVPQPRLIECVASLLQYTGYENPGVEAVKKDILPQLIAEKATFILNICGKCYEDFAAVARTVEGVDGVAALELNLSCVNSETGKPFGVEAIAATRLIETVKAQTTLPLIAKLTPNVTDITEIAKACEAAGADALSMINPVDGLALNAYLAKPVLSAKIGGLCGPAIKPIALRAVWQTAQVVKIPIIGCGGITNGFDVLEFLQAGASAVQIGTSNFVYPSEYAKMLEVIINFMKMNGMTKMDNLIGLTFKNLSTQKDCCSNCSNDCTK